MIRYLLLLFLTFQGVAWSQSPITRAPADVELEPVLAAGHVLFLQGGDLYALGADDQAPLQVRKRGAAHTRIISPVAAAVGKRLVAAWIEKGPEGNSLYAVSMASDGRFTTEPRPLASNTASTFAQLVKGPGDTLYLLDGAAGREPALSLSRSVDTGRNFQRTPLSLEGFQQLHQVSAVIIGTHLHLFLHGVHQERSVITVLDYDIEQGQAGTPKIVTHVPSTPLLQALAIQGSPAILYKRYQDGQFSLNLARRGAQGWHSAPIPGTEDLDVARLDHHVWKDGRVLIVFSGERRGRSKQRVYAALSEDGGTHWRTTQLDSAVYGNTRAWLPRLAVKDNQVAVVWEDARQIRSGVRMQMSTDRGATWLDRDLPVSDARRHAMRPGIGKDKDGLHIAWLQYASDARETLNVAVQTFGWNDLVSGKGRSTAKIADTEKEARLRKRVDTYWQAMMKNDHQAAYQAHDPFYRARIPFLQYAAGRGPIVYHRYEIKDLAIRGNEAMVQVALTYSVPKLKAMGLEKNVPPRDFLVRDIWLFIDGAWQRKFVDAMSGGSAIRY